MGYGNDMMDNAPMGLFPQYKTCGTFGGGMASPQYSQSAYPSQYQQGTAMGAQNGMTVGAQQPVLPTGFPTGASPTPLIPTVPVQQHTFPGMAPSGAPQVPVTVESTLFTPGFLKTQIGRKMRVEFLIGTNGFTDRTGTLVAVGASYIILRPVDSDDLVLCDIYSIKFVTIIR